MLEVSRDVESEVARRVGDTGSGLPDGLVVGEEVELAGERAQLARKQGGKIRSEVVDPHVSSRRGEGPARRLPRGGPAGYNGRKPGGSMKKLTTIALIMSALGAPALSADWPQWRGPKGNGVSEEKGLPVSWTNDRNIAWRAKLEGQGVSSPVVSGDLVIVTSQVGRGDVRPGNHPMLGQRGDPNERPSFRVGERHRGIPRRGLRPQGRETGLAVSPSRRAHRGHSARGAPEDEPREPEPPAPTANASMPGSAPGRWWPWT
jgi:hypothetical protein